MQTSQTGGQWYNDTSPFSNPWINYYQFLKMTSFKGLASWAKMIRPGGKLIALACHATQPKKVNKAEEVAYPTTNVGLG